MTARSGRHFLQVPGPTNVPDRVLRAIDNPVIDHRGPDFVVLAKSVIAGLKRLMRTTGKILIYPSSGTGAWEAAILNTLSPGDKVLAFETGQFSTLWNVMARRHGLEVDFVPGDWRHGVDPAVLEAKLGADRGHAIKAVMVVHNETSTGVTSDVAALRKVIDRVRHPALFMVDAISSLCATDFRMDEWGIDVTVVGSQKGLMLPPGLAFNAVSEKALAAHKTAKLPRGYFEWQPMIDANDSGLYPFTPPIPLFQGLKASIEMLEEEGLETVFARHARFAEATRRAVKAWGLDYLSVNPHEASNALTAVMMPESHNADAVRATILERFDLSLGAGLGKVAGKIFRIGHLGWFNDLMLMGTLAGVEMGLGAAGVPHRKGGVDAAMDYLSGNTKAAAGEPARAAAGGR
ncbi:MAG TPA: aminotransferase class V-fold PLP-dependent enzyme [Stellaceae bacterium]|nr:aminotransferase class V-fold PLP-dependent enzyme [Stellaceae bacterium]